MNIGVTAGEELKIEAPKIALVLPPIHFRTRSDIITFLIKCCCFVCVAINSHD